MNNISKKLGKRIQELRKMHNFTQSQLAESVGVEVVTISRIENGNRFPQKENLENIAKVLNVSIKDLFDYEHYTTKSDLLKEIQGVLKNSSIAEIQYFYRMLRLYKESK